jgi:hypothetical protein
MEGIVAVRRNELTEDLVSFFVWGFFRNPTQAFRDAKDMGIDRERG